MSIVSIVKSNPKICGPGLVADSSKVKKNLFELLNLYLLHFLPFLPLPPSHQALESKLRERGKEKEEEEEEEEEEE